MYLDRGDAVALLARLAGLAPGGRIILRESGVRRGVEIKTGEYQVAYRSVREYEAIARNYQAPVVITGFEPLDLLDGVLRLARLLEAGLARVENQYSRVVAREGNAAARALIWSAFEVCDRKWRGIGAIPKSGLRLRWELADFDAERRFDVGGLETEEPAACISGQILRGLKKPHDCPAFGTACTPEHPFGATMVSAEGACAAYYHFGRFTRTRLQSATKEAARA